MPATDHVRCPKCDGRIEREDGLRPLTFLVADGKILACPHCKAAFAAVARE